MITVNKFMFLAIEEARQGIISGEGGPFGTVIVKGWQGCRKRT